MHNQHENNTVAKCPRNFETITGQLEEKSGKFVKIAYIDKIALEISRAHNN